MLTVCCVDFRSREVSVVCRLARWGYSTERALCEEIFAEAMISGLGCVESV